MASVLLSASVERCGIFSNNLDIYDYVGKLPEQHFSVWKFSNPGDKILLLLKFNEARILEWNISKEGNRKMLSKESRVKT